MAYPCWLSHSSLSFQQLLERIEVCLLFEELVLDPLLYQQSVASDPSTGSYVKEKYGWI